LTAVTAELARFVAETPAERFSEPALAAARLAFLDTVAVAVAGGNSPAGRQICAHVAEQEARSVASVLGSRLKTTVELAALANGTLSHALDFDDTNHILDGHSSAHLVPVVLAAGESCGASYRDCLEAFLVGYQVETAIGAGMNPAHFRSGFHPTGTIATLGATAAVARLRHLSAADTVTALGVAVSSAAGLRVNVGTMTKPLHAGLAASAGVRATSLAALGWEATAEAIEGRYGFAATHAGGGEPDLERMLELLDGEWAVLLPAALVVKPYPCCAGTHPAIEAGQELRERPGFDPAAIERVTVTVGEVLPTVLVHDRPQTGNEAKFSLRYTLARALAHGRAQIADFQSDALADPAVRRLMDLIDVVVDDPGLGVYGVVVEVAMAGGENLRISVADPRVEAAAPISEEQLRDKVLDCVDGDGRRARLLREVLGEAADSVPCSELIDAATPLADLAHR
jgi:2-methylcitrate dehydratase PrpD